jgi:hypothetical protein
MADSNRMDRIRKAIKLSCNIGFGFYPVYPVYPVNSSSRFSLMTDPCAA